MDSSKSQASQSHQYKYEIVGDIYLVPLVDIYVDPVFNCRGFFSAQEVYSLAQDIKEEGQLQPLTIQPIDDVSDAERPDPCEWVFRLIAGHRRYMAIQYWTDSKEAACCIKTGLTREQARALNLLENLQRKDLNILQVAEAMVRNWPTAEIKDVARLMGQSKRWVQTHFDLMRLPEYVQRKAASGRLSIYDVETLAQLPEQQIEATFQKIMTSKGRVSRTPVVRGRQSWRNRPRGNKEINGAINFLYAHSKFAGLSDESRDYIVSTLAYVAKEISSAEFFENRLGFPADCVIVDEKDKVVGLKNEE